MCGIYGSFLKQGMSPEAQLNSARERLRHRGPDEQGLFKQENVALGHTRLSIIDLSTGQQPMHSADGRYTIVFNGEIYNFQELRERRLAAGDVFRTHSDTEVILSLYAARGEDCVLDMRGMFAFAIYDHRERSLFLARDRLGVKPLFYAQTPAGFFFASELPALLALSPQLESDWNWDALVDYFARQYIVHPQTAYRDALKLEPGHTLRVREGEIAGAPRRYWFPEQVPQRRRTQAQAREELRALFFEATRLRLISEVPLGAFLSGGMDSSITVSVMAKLLGRKFSTYSIGFGEAEFDERRYAQRVAQHCGTEHHELTLEYNQELPALVSRMIHHFGEPFADTSMIPSFYVAQLARRGLTVVLTGDGADEVWGGYKRHYHAAFLALLKKYHLRGLWVGARRTSTAVESLFGKKKRFPVNQLDQLLVAHQSSAESLTCKLDFAARGQLFGAPELLSANQSYSFLRAGPDLPGWNDLERFLFYDVNTFLAGDVLPKVDIATMMNSLEARSPFLDHNIVEFAFSLTPDLRRPRLKEGKSLLKRTFADLVPPGHFERPKMGFSPPLATWLRTLLRDWCGDLLNSTDAKAWLNQPLLLKKFAQHQGGQNHSRLLWMAAVFCDWVWQRKHT